MKKGIAIVMCLVLAAFTLAGCGQGAAPAPGETATTGTATGQVSGKPSKRVWL